MEESGLAGFENSIWFGLWAPAHTPTGIVDKIAADTARSLTTADLRERLRTLVAEPIPMKRAEFASFVRSEIETAIRIARAAGIKPQ